MWGLIALFILSVAHFLSDKDFPEEVKTVTLCVFIVLSVLYILFGLII